MKQFLDMIFLVVYVALAFALAVLVGIVPGDKAVNMGAVFTGLLLGPTVVCYSLATLNGHGPLVFLLKVTAVLAAGTIIVLSNFQSAETLGKEIDEVVSMISKSILAAGVFLTSMLSIVEGVGNKENKEYWQRRHVPFAQSFAQLGMTMVVPIMFLLFLDRYVLPPNTMTILEELFGQVAAYQTAVALSFAGLAGATLLAVGVIVRLHYRPWFEIGKSASEARIVSALWVIFMVAVSTAILALCYFMAQRTGMILWAQQVGSDQQPLFWGLGFTVVAVLVASLLAKWRVDNYVLEP
jgi:hypothetical protein